MRLWCDSSGCCTCSLKLGRLTVCGVTDAGWFSFSSTWWGGLSLMLRGSNAGFTVELTDSLPRRLWKRNQGL
jgi:hypothetical protein